MKHYAGLDVSVKETSVCIVDENYVGNGRLSPTRRTWLPSWATLPLVWKEWALRPARYRSGCLKG